MIILVDTSALAWQSFYAMGGLSYDNQVTGTAYGVFGTILQLENIYPDGQFVFCFDSKHSKRKQLCQQYKATRKSTRRDPKHVIEQYEAACTQPEYVPKPGEQVVLVTKDELLANIRYEAYANFFTQIRKLRKFWLPKIGYRHVFQQAGYEGDDLIASICQNLPTKQTAVIVSGDSDLYQCLADNVFLYNPRTRQEFTCRNFQEKYSGLRPNQWAKVKALTGCATDELPGIMGIGEKSAIEYLLGKLPKAHKRYQLIRDGLAIARRNMPLVKLPLEGTKTWQIGPREKRLQGWDAVMARLGFETRQRSIL